MASDVTDAAHDLEGKALFDGCSPLAYLLAYPAAVQTFRRIRDERLRSQGRRKRIARRAKLCCRKGKPLTEVAKRRDQVTQLSLAGVQPIAGAKNCLFMQEAWRPCHRNPRLKVAVIRVVKRYAGRAVSGGAGQRVEGQIAAIIAGEGAEVVIAKAKAQQHVAGELVLILKEEIVFKLARILVRNRSQGELRRSGYCSAVWSSWSQRTGFPVCCSG